MTGTFKVVSQTDPMDITKLDGTITQKSSILLQELGSQYEDTYSCTLLGNGATLKFYPGDIVLASLRFTAHQYQDQFYQDILVQEIFKLK